MTKIRVMQLVCPKKYFFKENAFSDSNWRQSPSKVWTGRIYITVSAKHLGKERKRYSIGTGLTQLQTSAFSEAVAWRCSVKRMFTKFTGKHLCQSFFFIKAADSRPLKKRLWHRCFPINFAKHLFLQNTSGGCFCIFFSLRNSYCEALLL